MARPPRSPHAASRPRRTTGEPRSVDKSRTRRALLDGALDLLRDRSLDNLGIREVTRAAGVAPAAFYRHFQRIDDLGLVLVDEAFTTLRDLMNEARADVADAEDIIERSVSALVAHVRAHPDHYRFIAREQFSPVTSVKLAIRREIKLFATELATDLSRLPVVNTWPTPDLVMLADLIVGLMVDTAKRLIDVFEEAPEREPEVVRETERRLRYLSFAATVWRPQPR
jgi:AcrR family transcriptional regulator